MILTFASPRLPAAAFLLALGAPVALPSQAAAPARVSNVQIRNFAFAPAMLTVQAGTTVMWTNSDEDPHTVTATGKAFHSAALDTGGRYSFTFTRPGDYAYFCSLHPHMTGRIVVTAR